MSLLDSLKKLFTGGSGAAKGGSRQALVVYAQDHRCGEPVQGEINLLSELSKGDASEFYVRKVLHTSGKKRCFGQVEIELWFDNRRNLQRHQVTGGKWLSADEYAVALERFNAPPEEDQPDSVES